MNVVVIAVVTIALLLLIIVTLGTHTKKGLVALIVVGTVGISLLVIAAPEKANAASSKGIVCANYKLDGTTGRAYICQVNGKIAKKVKPIRSVACINWKSRNNVVYYCVSRSPKVIQPLVRI